MDSSTLTLWTGQYPVKKGFWSVLLLPWFTEIPVLNANSVDPDQTPRSAASDLGLHCLPMSRLWDARLKWVNSGTAANNKHRFGPHKDPLSISHKRLASSVFTAVLV